MVVKIITQIGDDVLEGFVCPRCQAEGTLHPASEANRRLGFKWLCRNCQPLPTKDAADAKAAPQKTITGDAPQESGDAVDPGGKTGDLRKRSEEKQKELSGLKKLVLQTERELAGIEQEIAATRGGTSGEEATPKCASWITRVIDSRDEISIEALAALLADRELIVHKNKVHGVLKKQADALAKDGYQVSGGFLRARRVRPKYASWITGVIDGRDRISIDDLAEILLERGLITYKNKVHSVLKTQAKQLARDGYEVGGGFLTATGDGNPHG